MLTTKLPLTDYSEGDPADYTHRLGDLLSSSVGPKSARWESGRASRFDTAINKKRSGCRRRTDESRRQ
jgi:hypothetical protein